MDTKLIIGYCRVSTQKQFSEGHALERYIEALTKFGIPESLVFFDVESGISEDRKGFNAVLALVTSDKVSQVVIPNFDRLTRSPSQWESARDLFSKHNVQLTFLEEGDIDLDSPDGKFTGRIKAALAAQVRDRIRHHSLTGHAKHRERKEPYKPIFGYVKIDGVMRPNLDTYPESNLTYFQVARVMVDLFLKYRSIGKTLLEFRKNYYTEASSYYGKIHLKYPSRGFKRWLTNAILRGQLQYLSFGYAQPQLLVDSTHEPLITDEEWLLIKNILDTNKDKKIGISTDKLENSLSGVARCKNCEGLMSQRTGFKRADGSFTDRFLVCRNARERSPKCDPAYAKTYGLSILEAEKLVQQKLADRSVIVANIELPIQTSASPEMEILIKSIEKLESLNDPDIEDALQKKRTRLIQLQESEKISENTTLEKIELLQCLKHPDFWDGMSSYDRNSIYRELIEAVWCNKGLVEVVPRI
jgi:site-specific DNA recombinase